MAMVKVPIVFLHDVATFLAVRSKNFLIALGVGIVLAVGVIDHLAGEEISVAIFYLVPVALVTWFVGRRAGVFISFLSGMTLFVADLTSWRGYLHPLILCSNATGTVLFFLVLTFTLSALENALEAAQTSARTDPLTGISNSTTFSEVMSREIERARRYGHSLSLSYIDLDDFKAVNDRFGHSVGDISLQSVAKTMKENIREIDTVARLGGDEFAILLPETGPKAAQEFIDRIRDRLTDGVQAHGWPVTFSIGVATFKKPPIDDNEAIRIADGLMYSAKNSGKNKIKFKVLGNSLLQPVRAAGIHSESYHKVQA